MHSSRMGTARRLTLGGGGLLTCRGWGCLLTWACLLTCGGVCLPVGGVCMWGVPPVNGQTPVKTLPSRNFVCGW